MHRKVIRKNSIGRLDEMLTALRREIGDGTWRPGSNMPSEKELAKRFRLGNNSVRKGLEQLVSEGLIRKIPRVGNQVIRNPSEQTMIKLGIYTTTGRETDLSVLLDCFHKLNPDIHVQTVTIPTQEYAELTRQYMTEGILDAAIMNNGTFDLLAAGAKTDVLEPIEAGEDHYSFTAEAFQREGILLAQPLLFSPLVICYNVDHLKALKLPEPAVGWTWEDLNALAQQLTINQERLGFFFQLLSRNRWPLFLLQSGIDFLPDDEGRYHLQDSRLIGSLGVCRKLVERPDVFPTILSGQDSRSVEWFKDGKVSMIMTTYYSLNLMKDDRIPYDLAPPPQSVENGNLLTVMGIAISRSSPRKEAARRMAAFLGSYEAQLIVRTRTLSIPSHRKAAEWDGVTEAVQPSRFSIFREMIPGFRLIRHASLNSKKVNALQKPFELYLVGLQDDKAMCRQMEKELNQLDD